jgi:hypothetical protein
LSGEYIVMKMTFLRVIIPSAIVFLGIVGYGIAQYTNFPNTSTGTAIGSIFLSNVVTTPPTNYSAGQVQPTTQDTSGNLNINCKVGCSAASDPANGPVVAGTVALNSKLIGGQFNSTLPILGNGQQAALQLDSSGRILEEAIGPVTPGTVASNSKLVGGQFNSSAPTLTAGQQSALQVDAAGNLNVNIKAGQNAGGTSSNFAASFPTTGTAIGVKNGVNMTNLTADGSNNLNINCAVGCSAASDTSNGPVVAATAATTSKLGGLVFNTSAPSLTNAQQVALQGDSTGNLLVNLKAPLPTGASVIGQVGGTTVQITVSPTVTVAAYSSGQCVGGLLTFSGAARSGGPGSSLAQSAVISDVSGQDANIDLIVFNANPTGSTFTDHATCTVANADLAKIAGTMTITDCHLLGSTAPGMCQAQQQAIPVALGSGNTTAYGVMISRGTPTYTASTNIKVVAGLLED